MNDSYGSWNFKSQCNYQTPIYIVYEFLCLICFFFFVLCAVSYVSVYPSNSFSVFLSLLSISISSIILCQYLSPRFFSYIFLSLYLFHLSACPIDIIFYPHPPLSPLFLSILCGTICLKKSNHNYLERF